MADDADGASADSRGHTRRAILAASAAAGGAGIASALSGSGTPGNLWGGTMALSEAFNVSGDLWIGPDSAKSNVDATDGRVYMASDTQVEYYGDGGSWAKLGVGSSSTPVPEVHAEDATIRDFGHPARYTITYDPNRPSGEGLVVTKAEDGSEFFTGGDTDLAAALQAISDQGEATRIHLTQRPDNWNWTIDQQVVFDEAFHLTSDGRNRPNITPADGLSQDMFVLQGTETRFITIFSNVKIDGRNRSNLGTISAIRNENHMELLFDHTEIRSMPKHGVHWKTDITDDRWNQATASWFLDNGEEDFYFDSAATGNLLEYTFSNCMIHSTNGFGGIVVADGAPVQNINVNGGRIRGPSALLFNDGQGISITGVTVYNEGNRAIYFNDRASEHVGTATVTGCTFLTNPNNAPFHHIRVGDNWTDVTIANNEYDTGPSSNLVQIDNATVWRNGTLYMSGAPSGTDFDHRHTGRTIIDTSTSPPTRYYVDDTGGLIQP